MLRTLITLVLIPLPAIAAPVKPDQLPAARIDVTWSGHSVNLYVSGGDSPAVGLWDRSTQIKIGTQQVRKIYSAIERARFDSMPGSFGGIAQPKGGRALGRPEILVGSVSRTVNGKTHSVSQLQGENQSEELAALAKEIIDACAEAAKTGVTAKDLKDGLRKIQKHELAPKWFT
jgi:hypothetical protein